MAAYDFLLTNTGASSLATNGTATFLFPSGRQVGDFVRGTETLSVPGRQTTYAASGNFSLRYTATSVILTWTNALTLPPYTLLRLGIQTYDTANPTSPYLGTLVTPVVGPPGGAYLTGKNYTMIAGGSLASTAVTAVDIIYFYPFPVFAPITFTGAAIRSSVGGVGSSVKSGIWLNSAISHRPVGLPLYSDNSGPATTGTGQIAIPMTGVLDPGWYWFGSKFTGTLPSIQSTNFPMGAFIPNSNLVSALGLSLPDAYANDIAAFTIAEGSGSFSGLGTALPALQLNT